MIRAAAARPAKKRRIVLHFRAICGINAHQIGNGNRKTHLEKKQKNKEYWLWRRR